MIYDLISEWTRYRRLTDGVAEAFEYLQRSAVEKMPDGRHDVDGDRIFLLLSTSASQPEAEKRFESHRTYLDIQVVLKGSELHFWAPAAELVPDGGYSDEKDIIFYEGSAPTSVLMVPGRFALYLPSDGHKPGCRFGESRQVRKAVLKVRL
jgi:biofilm protein TabA